MARSQFEVLTLLVALLSVIPGVIAMVRQCRQRKRMDQLEDAQLRQNLATASASRKASSYNATVSWTDPNGSRIENAAYVAI